MNKKNENIKTNIENENVQKNKLDIDYLLYNENKNINVNTNDVLNLIDKEKRKLVLAIAVLTVIFLAIANLFIVKAIYNQIMSEITATGDEAMAVDIIERNIAPIGRKLKQEYLGDVNQKDLIKGAIKGYVDGLGDPYTKLYTKEEWDEIYDDLQGNLTGVGILARQEDLGVFKIVEVIENSPALEQGIKAGDYIIGVDDVNFENTDITLDEAVDLIKGEPETNVKLIILRDGEKMEKVVTRRQIKINHVKGQMLKDDSDIGYIHISQFDTNVDKDFKEKFKQLEKQGMKKLILDLRNNTGGNLTSAEGLAEFFLDKDLIMYQTRNKQDMRTVQKTKKNKETDIPLIILANEYSASASELFTAAMKENDRGIFIGRRTYGKGVIQTVAPIITGDVLKITTEEYLTPKGDIINKVGIKPNIDVKIKAENLLDLEIGKINLEKDDQLIKAKEYLENGN